ncbi:Por secretion system C-terminal sorting domain-containing protein [Catalinimonas alkaloidigena]|uniref:Por secretion system C-terminal sorting domain-containing protein n=1 Tax=Catalinimonas alkaloidigena TaxID=1075417 RepID=A0A1G9HGX8_9BACT|nr:T9SS type A sorting domain-containing protein [Catalinimonas alkaloidigena]SDL12258.1 Por secretion system C-terminal sorting domain-containing protein [Catalinimonas alkaloidigena]
MRKFFPILLFGTCVGVQAQSLGPTLLAPAGGVSTDGAFTLSWSVGEPVVETFSTPEITLTQGFHQANLVISKVDRHPEAFQVQVFPNPTSDQVTLELAQKPGQYVVCKLLDVQGRTLLTERITQDQQQLDLRALSAGTYILMLLTPEREQPVATYKIQKVK